MLEGKRAHLRVTEKEDVPLLVQWFNDVEFAEDYQHFPVQISKSELEKQITEQEFQGQEWVDFVIEKKDGARIEWIVHYVGAPT